MNYEGIHQLFKIVDKINGAVKSPNVRENNRQLLLLLMESIPDYEIQLGKAFEAYSKQGYTAIPLPRATSEHEGFFNWEYVVIVKKNNMKPTEHHIINLPTTEFVIQYLISGGFKSENVNMDDDAMLDEFSEARTFIQQFAQ